MTAEDIAKESVSTPEPAAAEAAPAAAAPAADAAASTPEPAEAERPPMYIILASASPRRKQLLADAGVKFAVRYAEADETLDDELKADPFEAAKKLAERKAGAVVQEILASNPYGMFVVIGADTMVVKGSEIFGKPHGSEDAKRVLRELSGCTHEVMTGVSVWLVLAHSEENVSVGLRSFTEVSRVTFKDLSDKDIADYLRRGESFDKAGAYAIQGAGADLVDHVDGSLSNVIGLPVEKLLQEFPDLLQ